MQLKINLWQTPFYIEIKCTFARNFMGDHILMNYY